MARKARQADMAAKAEGWSCQELAAAFLLNDDTLRGTDLEAMAAVSPAS
jgi:hypothetical protein